MRRFRYCFLLLTVVYPLWLATPALASCSSPANAIEAENCLPGTPQTTWDVSGAGDSTIQGFTTDISVNVGQTVSFKISTNATNYKLDIYRLGYYGGAGARLVTTITPSAHLPQTQPACITDSATALMDCGNWAVSATWTVPADCYVGHLFRRRRRGRIPVATAIFPSSCAMTPAPQPFFSKPRIRRGRLTTTTAVRTYTPEAPARKMVLTKSATTVRTTPESMNSIRGYSTPNIPWCVSLRPTDTTSPTSVRLTLIVPAP